MALCALLAAAACSGAQGPLALVEGYCAAGEADRCYYDHAPADGF